MFLVLLWLIEDLLTVFSGGGMQIPSIFMLGIVYKLLTEENEDGAWAIWSAFGGGFFWDIRWIGIPGFFTIGNVAVVLIVIQVWNSIPPQGRESGTGIIVFSLLELSQVLPPIVPVLILGGNMGWNFFIRQQLYALPVLIICIFLYDRHVREASI